MTTALAHKVLVNATPVAVFTALSTSKGLAGFWTSDSDAAPVVGSVARFGFGQGSKVELLVEDIEPNRRMCWRTRSGSPMPPPWDGTTLIWEINELSPGETEVTFTHAGWPAGLTTADLEATDAAWKSILERLKTFVETGKPVPLIA